MLYLPLIFRLVRAYSVDLDQMLHSAVSDKALHCLLLIQQFVELKGNCSDFRRCMVRN